MDTFSVNDIHPLAVAFTKAELLYALFILMKDVPLTNNCNHMELLELRHYLNQIREKVTKSTYDGSLVAAIRESIHSLSLKKEKDNNPLKSQISEPKSFSLEMLKSQFPNLTENEIREVIEKAREENTHEQSGGEDETISPPLPNGFMTKGGRTKEDAITKNSRKFVALLGKLN